MPFKLECDISAAYVLLAWTSDYIEYLPSEKIKCTLSSYQ